MSDKQKGLINAIQSVWLDAEHRFCVKHMCQNFQRAAHEGEVLKNDLWAIARSTDVPKWQVNSEKMFNDNEEAYAWVEQLVPDTWIKAFYSEFPKCDMQLNNHSEVYNSYILQARALPVLSMLETIFYKMVRRIQTKQKDPEKKKWPGTICPKIKKKIDKFTAWAADAFVLYSGGGLYHVRFAELEWEYCVDMNKRMCECRRQQLIGIPCHHAIACYREARIDPESMVHSCYNIDTYRKAYEDNLVPMRGRLFWEKTNGVKVHPPLYTKVMGRPKHSRKKAHEEKEINGAKHITKHGCTMHCSICGKADHKKKGHNRYVEQHQDDEEQEDVDDPSILQNLEPQNPNPILDPMNQRESMIHRMDQ